MLPSCKTYKLEHHHWGEDEASFSPIVKGRAIDNCLREMMGSTAPQMESFDLKTELHDISYHEFKSTSTGSISISPMELDLAERKIRDNDDVLYWVINQGRILNEFELKYFVRFSDLQKHGLLEFSVLSTGVYFWMSRAEHIQYLEPTSA